MKLWCLKYVCRQMATIGVKGLNIFTDDKL